MKIHWQPTQAVSWPSGGKRNPRMRTFLLAGNIVCHADGEGTSVLADVTCGNCRRKMQVARYDSGEVIAEILARGTAKPVPVTDPDLDAPDGAIVDGRQRVGDAWHAVPDQGGAGTLRICGLTRRTNDDNPEENKT